MGIGKASTALVGQAIGDGDIQLAKIYHKAIMNYSCFFWIFEMLFLHFFFMTVASKFTNEPEVLSRLS